MLEPTYNKKVLQWWRTRRTINKNFFRRLRYINDQLYEVELVTVKSEVVHKEPMIVWFCTLQFASLRKPELYYNFFDKYCYVTKFEELEMDTNWLYLAVSEHDLYDCIQPAMKRERNSFRSRDCTDEFSADSTTNFVHRTCCLKHKKHDRWEPGLFKDEFRCTKIICLCSNTYFCCDSQSKISNLTAKAWIKKRLKTVVMASCPNIAKFWKRLLI